jgi:hypothetical protein
MTDHKNAIISDLPKIIYYYRSKHYYEDGKDEYYNVIPKLSIDEGNPQVIERMMWYCGFYSYHPQPGEKMISFKDSGIEDSLTKIIKEYEEEEKSRKWRVQEYDRLKAEKGSHYAHYKMRKYYW